MPEQKIESDPLVAAVESAQRAVSSLAQYIQAAQALENYILDLVAGDCPRKRLQSYISCKTWLDYAYVELRRGGEWANRSADILEKYRRGSGIWRCDELAATVILFRDSLGPIQSPTAPLGDLISLPRDYLGHTPGSERFGSDVAVLAHELWHTEQTNRDRLTTWGEIDAYSLQAHVLEEFALEEYLPLELHEYIGELLHNRPGDTPRDIRFLCRMREALLEMDNLVYSNEPLFWGAGMPIIAQWCPSTGGPRRINPATGEECTIIDELMGFCIDVYDA